MTQQQPAQDALIRVFNQDFSSSSNTITDAITGLTIDLRSNTSASGDTGTATVSLNQAAVTTKIDDFIDAYNSLIETLDTLGEYDATTQQAGALQGDATLRTVASNIRRELSTAVSESGLTFTTLAEIGITTQRDGTLLKDSTTLGAVLDSNFDDVAQLFASETGYATRLDTLVNEFVSTDGPIESRLEGLNSLLSDLADDRIRLDARAATLDERFRNQFAALDQFVAELNTIGDFLTQNLASLPGFGRQNG